jgi:superfamily I DNA/RNA helicase
MAVTIPIVAPQGCTPGERLVFNSLQRNLSDEYFIWFEPTLFGQKQSARPDFVVLARHCGIIIVEVKDWDVRSIRSGSNRDTVRIGEGRAEHSRTNPEKQVLGHLDALMGEIDRYRSQNPEKYQLLVQETGTYRGKLAVPYSYLVAFPNIRKQEWAQSELSNIINIRHVLLREDLDNNLNQKFSNAVPFPSGLTQEQIDVPKWMLYPEIRIRPEQLPLLDVTQASLVTTDLALPPKQEKLVSNVSVKLVRGTVGSGKTLILLKRAKFLSERFPSWQILVLTYNKSLKSYLDRLLVEIGGDPTRIQILNFHKWCHDLLEPVGSWRSPQKDESRAGLLKNILTEMKQNGFSTEFLLEEFDWIKERIPFKEWDSYIDPDKVKRTGREHGLGINERQEIYGIFRHYQAKLEQLNACDWSDVPVHVLQSLNKGLIQSPNYDAVLIDEAQDFAPSWFRVITRTIKPRTGTMFIVGDGAQKIYRRDFTWKEVGILATSQNTTILTKGYRNTHEILDVAIEVVRNSQNIVNDLKDSGDIIAEPDAELKHGPLPFLMAFEDGQREYSAVAHEILQLLNRGYLPQQIAIFHRHRARNEHAVSELRKSGVPSTVISDNMNLNLLEPTVKICTLHSAKGLEFEIVFICGLDDFSTTTTGETEEEHQEILDQERKLLYVGMTRAKQRLYVTYSGIEPAWIIERAKEKFSKS